MRIIKREKGSEEYLYLQHSYRTNGKVITKELYLGKEVPANIEELKARLLHDPHKALSEKLDQINANFQKEWVKIPESAKEKYLKEIAIAFTYNTNAIEGSTITLEEARLILEDKVAPSKSLREIRETESHAAVFLQMLRTRVRLSERLLLEWHERIFAETKHDIAGKYRSYGVRVGSHVAPDWHRVPELMRRLVSFVYESKFNSVETAARAHYIFEKVHPFGDGNGRIGRLLMNHILWRNSYPMLIIEYKKRQSYYKALTRTEEGFTSYFIRRYLSVHGEYLSPLSKPN